MFHNDSAIKRASRGEGCSIMVGVTLSMGGVSVIASNNTHER